MKYVSNMLAKPKTMRTSQMASIGNVDQGMEIYLKNAYVCLKSVLLHNEDVKCILFVDFTLPEEWSERFKIAGIDIQFVKFGGYQISDNFDWGIVQYRYDVINYLCEKMSDDDEVIMLDTDVLCVGSLENVFREIKYRACFYDVQHAYTIKDRKNIIDNYLKIYPIAEHCELIHYGGEFIGCNGKHLKTIFEESKKVMMQSANIDSLVNFNDEHITSIALYHLWNEVPINNANAYIARYWTNPGMYLVSTNYQYNPVVLWHLPFEKNKGFLWVYDYMITKAALPNKSDLCKVFGLPDYKRKETLFGFCAKLKRKLNMLK